MKIPIKNNSKHGYLLAEDGDSIDLGVGRGNHRGSVKKGIAHTLKTEMDVGVMELKKTELCNKLIEENLVEEMDMIYHSYSSNRLSGDRPINTTQNKDRNVSAALTTRPDTLGIVVKDEAVRLGGLFDTEEQRHQAGSIWDKDGLSPNIDTMQGGYRQPLITETKLVGGVGDMKSNNGTQYYQQDRVYDAEGTALCQSAHGQFNPWYAVAMRGRDGEQRIEPSTREEANAITTVQKDSMAMNNMRIRKLTPKECWRLMGWDDESFAKAESVNSNSQLYKQAGNGIVVNCFAAIVKELL